MFLCWSLRKFIPDHPGVHGIPDSTIAVLRSLGAGQSVRLERRALHGASNREDVIRSEYARYT